MYDLAELDQLVAAMRATGTVSLTVRARGTKLCLRLPSGDPPGPDRSPRAKANVMSPGIGTFHPRGMDDGLAPLRQQAHVVTGEILGYVAQGAALTGVIAPASGRLAGEMPRPGRICGFGDILFTMETGS
ncbi:hypothetical protein [Paracoccus sp. (in: a-proteobacteria)]|uniref:hypothetical protein n=1 Tax=Paracoccus sp. TaxID=267 RepID=UPI003A8888B9